MKEKGKVPRCGKNLPPTKFGAKTQHFKSVKMIINYNVYMNKLEKLNNINYNHSFENASLSERRPALQYPTQDASTTST
jgi:hypothetical protein